ncbi:hypothetical protein C0J52_17949 [Blattella germanica]|nr:hypothetical protein C0J52_17949 [Blattella germanica]
MVEYTFEEYTEMLIIYGEAGRNGRTAQRIIQQRLRETGTFISKRTDCGARQTRRSVEFEEEILHHLEENRRRVRERFPMP